MVSLTKLVIVLLLVLPCLFAVEGRKDTTASPSSVCSVTVSQKLTDSSSKYNTYTATVTNVGSSVASSIVLSSSATFKTIDGADESGNDKYTLSDVDTLAVGATYTFSYSVKKSDSVQWSATCTSVATTTTTTAKPTTTRAPATTTKAPATTTKAPTTTKAAATTKAPTTTTTKAPATTTKAPTTTTKAPATTTTTKATTTTAKAPASGATTKPTTSTGNSASSGGRTCSSGWWQPAPMTTWQWQLTGTVDTSLDVQMYDIDLFDATPALISQLHALGKTVICYFSTQYENWRPDAALFSAAVQGNNLDDWVGEKYVDIRSPVVRSIMQTRLDLALSKGCDGVEPDNVDGYQATTGFPLKAADQLDYNKFLADEAHSRGLSVGLKNDLDQVAALEPYFDWALNEQCNQYGECTALNAFVAAGKAVFNCEYSGSATSVCPKMVTSQFSTLFKALALDASIKTSCCSYAAGGCAKDAAYSCSSSSKRSLDAEEEPVPENDEISAQEAKMNSSAPTHTYASIMLVFSAVVALISLL